MEPSQSAEATRFANSPFQELLANMALATGSISVTTKGAASACERFEVARVQLPLSARYWGCLGPC